MTSVAQATRDAIVLVEAWRLIHPAEYAASRARHNRWQAAHATRLALAEWLEERRA